jgi:hypothetical protein
MNDKSQPNDRQHQPDQINDDARVDRLVDGELTPEEYRAFVASLDDESGGWRRCALAFLEEQALAGELGGIRQSLNLDDPGTGGSTTKPDGCGDLTPPRRATPRDLGTMLAVAASFLLAFALGVAAPRLFYGEPQEPNVAGNLKSQPQLAANVGTQPSGGIRHQALRPIGNLRLVMDGAGDETQQAGRVPVYEVDQGIEQYLQDDNPALAPELVKLLEQRGHDVQRQQQFIPVQLDDGRQIIVPVEGYQITPVGRRVY